MMPSTLLDRFRPLVVASLASPLFLGAVALELGCSSSSTTTHDVADAGQPAHDAAHDGHKADSGHVSKTDARRDTGVADAGADASAVDSGSDAGCPNFDAEVASLPVSAACENCLGQNCCSYATTCFQTKGCINIEACALKCVNAGTMPRTCAIDCIVNDGGPADAIPSGGFNPAQTAAEGLDLCLASSCPSLCGG